MAEITPVFNYIVPATGLPGAMPIELALASGVDSYIDFRDSSLDGVKFSPYGVIIDNTDGDEQCTVKIDGLGYIIRCGAGGVVQAKYPGPVDQTVTVTGNGLVKFIFVNYPL